MATSTHALSFYSKLDDDSVLAVDLGKIDNCKSAIKKDLTNMINAMKNIQNEYNTLIKKGYVKGIYKTLIEAALKKVNTYISELETRRKYLEIKIEEAKTQYMLKTIQELQKTVAELQASAAAGAVGGAAATGLKF